MTKKYLPLMSIALSAVVLIGCAEKRQPPPQQALVAHDASFEQVWDACVASLKEDDWQIDRGDRRFGLIVTKPEIGKQFFEFWRKDAASSEDLLNSSLHTIRRIVTIHIVKHGPMQFQIDVEARAQRVSIASNQLDSTVEASELTARQGVSRAPRRSYYPNLTWVDIGREPALEQVIMSNIASRLES